MPDPEPTKRLTDLELEIMQVIWDAQPERLAVRAVVDRLAEGGRPLAYTTVQTMMNILRKKGVLAVHKGSGRAHEYETLMSRAEACSSMTDDLVDRLFRGHAEPLMAQLLDHDSLGRSELEDLKRRIETQLEDEEPEAGTSQTGSRGGR